MAHGNRTRTIGGRGSVWPALVLLALLAGGCADPVSPKADQIAEQIAMKNTEGQMVLFAFDDATGSDPWRIINDTVMGGRSQSTFEVTAEGAAVFAGTVSLENNGGFAHTRSMAAPYDLSAYTGVALRVRGDGKTYKMTLKTDRDFDSAMYQTDFATEAGTWQEVRLPFGRFEPTHHGRRLEDHPALDASQIATLGFLISDKQAGPFRLEVDWIGAYKE